MNDSAWLSAVPAVPALGRLAGAANASTELGGDMERDEAIDPLLDLLVSKRGRMNAFRLITEARRRAAIDPASLLESSSTMAFSKSLAVVPSYGAETAGRSNVSPPAELRLVIRRAAA